jgi:hypothetical protein
VCLLRCCTDCIEVFGASRFVKGDDITFFIPENLLAFVEAKVRMPLSSCDSGNHCRSPWWTSECAASPMRPCAERHGPRATHAGTATRTQTCSTQLAMAIGPSPGAALNVMACCVLQVCASQCPTVPNGRICNATAQRYCRRSRRSVATSFASPEQRLPLSQARPDPCSPSHSRCSWLATAGRALSCVASYQ